MEDFLKSRFFQKRGFYLLDEHQQLVRTDDAMVWAEWFEHAGEKRIVEQTQVGNLFVSTVFIGLDLNLHGDAVEPFETAVFRDEDVVELERSATWFEAEQAHQRMVETLRAELAVADPPEDA